MNRETNSSGFRNNSLPIQIEESRNLPLVSDDVLQIFHFVNHVFLCGVISLFGIATNIFNIIVFYKQGFQTCIDFSFMGLAIADLCGLITMLWTSICYNPYFENVSGLPFKFLDIMYLTGGYPHLYCSRITSFITAFITFERCLCITLPLKVKDIVTPFITKFFLIAICLLMLVFFLPFYFVNKLSWRYDAQRNATRLILVYAHNREMVESVTFFIHSVAMSAFTFTAVIVCTVILVAKLNNKSKWRANAVVQIVLTSEGISHKEKKVAKMVILISTIFLVCYLPATINFFAMVIEPELAYTGNYINTFFVIWSVAFVLETINSSVNIFVYFNMSSKYKRTVHRMLYGRKE